tara:strand:+ start:261 stop:515 length:255 start_codon:yes stop_codon:yes gene_type:complete
MAKPKYNVVQGKDVPGRDKPIWLRHGVAFDKDGKISIKLESLPLPNADGEVWLRLFEDDGSGPNGNDHSAAPAPDGPLDDDIPF